VKTLSVLKQDLASTLAEIDELTDRYTKGELTPEEVTALEGKTELAESIKSSIETFPVLDDLGDRTKSLKSFAKRPATSPPPSAGRTTGGDGESAVKGMPSSFGIHTSRNDHAAPAWKTLGELVVDELARDRAAGGGWKSGVGNQSWGRELKNLMRLDGLGLTNDADDAEVKATLTSTTAPLTGYDRRPGVIDVATQRLTIQDLLGQGTTTQPTIRYVRETSYTNAATSVAEADPKPEASLALQEVDSPVRKVAVWTKVSEEMLDDFAQIQSFIDGRLRFMVLQREEALLYGGNGTAPNIRGLTATSGIQTQAQTSGLTAGDAIHMAITKIQAVGFDEPDGIVMHPTDWQHVKLLKDANEQYMGGGPFYTPYAGSGGYQTVRTLWGLPVAVTTAATAGTALVGAFKTAAQMFRRSGVSVQMTNTDQDDFINNLVTVRAEGRLALAVYRPLSFATVTGIVAGKAA
jgi:HK97 family phage major capsid protein